MRFGVWERRRVGLGNRYYAGFVRMGCRILPPVFGRTIGSSSCVAVVAAGLVLSALSPLRLSRAQAVDQTQQPQQQTAPRQVSENPGTLELTDLESKFRAIADKVAPSVVA